MQENSLQNTKVTMITEKCSAQNRDFKEWASQKNWLAFHQARYDWWAFPINQSSARYGTIYQLSFDDVQEMRKDTEFIRILRQNAVLVCKSWGWNLLTSQFIQFCTLHQQWQSNSVRLKKICKSLDIFHQKDLLSSALKYACALLDQEY